MTSGKPSGEKDPIPKETLNMIFNSTDFNKLLQSKDSVASTDFTKMFNTNDSTAALFKSQDFLKSLDAYKDALATNGPANTDPSTFFKSTDWLKSLDTIDWNSNSKSAAAAPPPTASATATAASEVEATGLLQHPGPPVAARKTPSNNNNKGAYTSQDWMNGYEPSHIDVDYDKGLFQTSELGGKSAAAASMPPKMPARAPVQQSESVSKWMRLYEEGLGTPASSLTTTTPSTAPASLESTAAAAAPVPAPWADTTIASEAIPSMEAAVPTPVASAPITTSDSNLSVTNTTDRIRKKRVYKSRKIIPEKKVYVDYTDRDVLLGRGGLSNKHPGNKRYRQEIENAKPVYRAASKDEKTHWASLLVEYVQKDGGRFLEKDKENGKWYIVPDIVARRKAGQALREENTAESRKVKRDRYKRAHGLM